MKRLAVLLALSTLVACQDAPRSVTAPDPAAPDDASLYSRGVGSSGGETYVLGQVLVGFKPGVDAAAIAAAFGARIERDIVFRTRLLRVIEGREAQIIAALQKHPAVEYAELDLIRTFNLPCDNGTGTCGAPNDPHRGYKWDLHNDGTIRSSSGQQLATTGRADADIDWLEAYDHLGPTFSGSAIVGIADTGVRSSHEDLTGRVIARADFFGSTNGNDDHGHGTHVAGIAAAGGNNGKGMMGVAYGSNIRIVSAKVCGPSYFGLVYNCPASSIAAGVRWLADQGAHAINLSLGGPTGTQTERDALIYARSKGALPICAAGNDGANQVSFPAAFPECVAVSSTSWSDGLASYSNYGPEIELSAPGGDSENRDGYSYILSSYYSSNTSYSFMAGTSMAAPQVSGLAALLHAAGVTGIDNRVSRMRSTADDLGAAGLDQRFGHGRINVYRAVADSRGSPPSAPSSARASVKSSSRIDLKWTDNSGDEDGFEIQRHAGDGNWATLQKTAANATSFSNSGLPEGTKYTYRVRAFNGSGSSGWSNEASATTRLNTPSNLVAQAKSSSQIDLTWKDNSGKESGYEIQRKTAETSYTRIARVGANVTAYSDTGLQSGTTYTYRVRAYNSSTRSSWSSTSSATTASP